MIFDYPSLEALAAVVKQGTFEAAARSLNITQSAVSQRIKALEEKIGVVLIRRGRPCVPTEFGFKLYRHIDQVMLLEQDLQKSLMGIGNAFAESLISISMAVNADSLATWFPEVIGRASERLNLLFDIIPDDQDYTAERLRNGEALAAVTAESMIISGCKRFPLGAMRYVAVATPDFARAHFDDGVTPETLARAICLFFDRKDMLQEQWLTEVFGRSISFRSHYVPSTPGYTSACLSGCGWGLVPMPFAEPHLKHGSLIELVPGSALGVNLYWQSSVSASEIMRELSTIVSDVARKHLDKPL